jgi:hypothetical protein
MFFLHSYLNLSRNPRQLLRKIGSAALYIPKTLDFSNITEKNKADFTRQNRKQKYLRYIIILLLFFPGILEASSNSDVNSSLHVSAHDKNLEFYKIKSYLINAGSLVSDTLGLPFSKACRIYLKDNLKKEIKIIKNKKGGLRIYLNSSYSLITKGRKVSRTLLRAFILSTLNLSYSKGNIKKINWLVNALNRKLDKKTFPAIYPDSGSFPCIHYLLINGYRLQPDIIINDRAASNKDAVYKINSEADEILLDSILSLKDGRKILVDYLKSVCSEDSKNNIEVFYTVLSRNIKLPREECETSFMKYLNNTAFKLSINSFMPASVKYTTNAFHSACIVSYSPKNSLDTIKECSLENLPEICNSIDYPDKLIQELKMKFVRLNSFSPFFLQKPINGIIKALREFRLKKEAASFRKNVLLYKKEFAVAATKEIEIRKLLQEKEKKHVRIPARYDCYFQVIDTDDNNLDKLWPELNNYLTEKFKFGN